MDPTIRPFLSGELPVMSESITELVFMIDEGKSMDKIYDALCRSDMRREGHDQPLTDEQKEDYKKAMKVDDVLRTEEHWDLEHPRYDLFIPRYVTLFRTWRDDAQVNQAEVLGTILAGSMINEDGLNVKEPGTRIESGAWTPNNYGDASDIVFVDTPWTRENLRHSIAARTPAITDANKQKLDELHEEIAKNDDDLKEGATALRTKKAELDEAKARYREAKVTAEADLATGEEMLKEMEDLFQEGQDLVPSR
ncbi:hypothetical protein UCREL1_4715 [Eutypa lata UCREL1]|uniref:Uncharacterized protein n=1 Tax=Eutypa lata (strain UCR-EL1) TaxID=1287681 RepID=M7SUS3_EUTLA|nr:hypothetical protein UCREL1_4715 [Eutypa lata UCREL1]